MTIGLTGKALLFKGDYPIKVKVSDEDERVTAAKLMQRKYPQRQIVHPRKSAS